MQIIDQVSPVKRQVPLDGLYLGQRLQELTAEIGRSLVLTDYLTDKNGVVAKAADGEHFKVPTELKNSSDWGRFQELMAQADVIISSGSYFKRLAKKGTQDILYQFEPGGTFEAYGQWRLQAGFEKRSPDMAIVSRHLDFEIPDELRKSGRKVIIFTSDAMANSEEARALASADTLVLGSGREGVDGGQLIAALSEDLDYRVIMMASGPSVLELLLAAKRLDLFYVTEVQMEIPVDDRATLQTLLPGGRKADDLPEFHLAHKFMQDHVLTENGSLVSQSFLRYDADALPGRKDRLSPTR